MKKILIAIIICFSLNSVYGQDKVKISELPVYTGTPAGALVPVVVGGINRKMDGYYFANMKIDSVWFVGNTLYVKKNGVTVSSDHTHPQSQITNLADSLLARYTKSQIDSLLALKLNVSDTAALMADHVKTQRFIDSLAAVQTRIQTKQPLGSYLVASNNLSDLISTSTARSNLGALGASDTSGKWIGIGWLTSLVNYSDTAGIVAGYLRKNFSNVTGVLGVANGGTGVSSFTANRLLIGNGTSGITTNAGIFYDPGATLLNAPGLIAGLGYYTGGGSGGSGRLYYDYSNRQIWLSGYDSTIIRSGFDNLNKRGGAIYTGDTKIFYWDIDGIAWLDYTISTGDNSKKVASTEWVKSLGYTTNTGTVTSVGISGANGIGVSSSPVTTSGTISLSLGAISPTSISLGGASIGTNLLAVGGTSQFKGLVYFTQSSPTNSLVVDVSSSSAHRIYNNASGASLSLGINSTDYINLTTSGVEVPTKYIYLGPGLYNQPNNIYMSPISGAWEFNNAGIKTATPGTTSPSIMKWGGIVGSGYASGTSYIQQISINGTTYYVTVYDSYTLP